jgi:L-iditol 2-dehydrogenase
MKSVRLHAAADLRPHDEPLPTPAPGESLVRVTAVGLCGSDLHWFEDGAIGDAGFAHPLVLGHEFAGVTEDGRRVAVDPAIPCGRCELCLAGHPNLCEAQRFAGYSDTDGGLREYVAWPERCLVPLPDALSDADGAMLEPLGIAVHAVDLGKIKPGMTVGVFGCGPIGLLVLQVARAAGATRLLVTEPRPHRLEMAQRLGGEPWARSGGEQVDVAFECAGEQAAVDDALHAARPGARIILVGIPSGDRTSFSASVARRKGLTLKLARRMKHTYPRAIRLVESGQVDVRSLVSHTFALEETPEAFATAQRREGLKVVVTPT